jgi:sugar lactone lactonase YvrE
MTSRHAVANALGRLGAFGAAALLIAVGSAGCAGTNAARDDGAGGPYSFWPPAPNEPRVQFLVSYGFSSDVEPERSTLDELVFGTERQVLPIGKPYGVGVWNGRIYVCDITNPRVVILDLVKQETRVMGTGGASTMAQPTAIACAPDGMKYVADRRVGRIFVFNASDQHVASFGETGFTPVGVAVHGNTLLVAEFDAQSVVVLDRFTGARLGTIGRPGGEDGGFIRPLGVGADDAGNVYVTDVIRGRIQKFAPDGALLYARGEIGDSPGNFVRPKHLAVDRDGIVYVVDAAFQNVQMFDEKGDVLMFFGGPGLHPGAMSLPAGITVAEDQTGLFERYVHPAFAVERLIVVTNQFGANKVAVYALGRLKEGHTIADVAPEGGIVAPAADGAAAPAAEPWPEGAPSAPGDEGDPG